MTVVYFLLILETVEKSK